MPRSSARTLLDDRVRIEHMPEAARDIVGFIKNRTRAELDSDSLFRRGLVKAVQQIGEAAASITDEGRSRVPDLPWGQIVAMRHVLVHVYWGVDLNRVWATARDDVPVLLSVLERACLHWPLPTSPCAAGTSAP